MSRPIGLLIGAGRTGIGLAFAINPTQSMRFLGVDTATARRLAWLAQMTAARDIALGLGTLTSTITGRGSAAWLLAGAACDAADAAAISAACYRKDVTPIVAAAVVAAAAAASATAVSEVLRGRRQPIVTAVT